MDATSASASCYKVLCVLMVLRRRVLPAGEAMNDAVALIMEDRGGVTGGNLPNSGRVRGIQQGRPGWWCGC